MIEFVIPLTKTLIVSEANTHDHWSARYKRHKDQKFIIHSFLQRFVPDINILPIRITLSRISPRFLDVDDNLPMAFKSWKDSIADYFIPGKAPGRADDTKKIVWIFAQEKGPPKEYGIRVKIIRDSMPSESERIREKLL